MEAGIVIWLPTGITVVAFIANAAYIKGVFGTKIEDHARRIGKIEEGVVWKDECAATETAQGGRLDRIETVMNGALTWGGKERRKG